MSTFRKKVPEKHTAVGSWGHPWRRAQLEEVAERIEALTIDKLCTRGRIVKLWLPVSSTTPGVAACSCKKNTTDTSDRSCISCMGTQFCPGFVQFLTETLFWASSEDTMMTVADTELITTKKVNVYGLVDGELTGTIITPVKAYEANPDGTDWEIKLDAYKRAASQDITLEYSLDAGTTWIGVTLTEVTANAADRAFGWTGEILAADLDPDGGDIQFRITLTRASVDDLTPAWEIVRMRRVQTERENNFWNRRRRDDWVAGSILICKPWTIEQDSLDPSRGRTTDHLSDKTWTVGLHNFDTTLTRNTPVCRIQDTLGPHAFYEFANGVMATERYVLTQTYVSTMLGTGHFTYQSFDDRKSQAGEPYATVW